MFLLYFKACYRTQTLSVIYVCVAWISIIPEWPRHCHKELNPIFFPISNLDETTEVYCYEPRAYFLITVLDQKYSKPNLNYCHAKITQTLLFTSVNYDKPNHNTSLKTNQKNFSHEESEEKSKESISSSTSEKIEFSSEISLPHNPFPSPRPTNVLKGEKHKTGDQRHNLKRRIKYPQRVRKTNSNDPLMLHSSSSSTSNNLSASHFSASSSSSSSLSNPSSSSLYTSRSNSRYRINRTKFTPKTKTTKLNSLQHRLQQQSRTLHRTATRSKKIPQRTRTRVRGECWWCILGHLFSKQRTHVWPWWFSTIYSQAAPIKYM